MSVAAASVGGVEQRTWEPAWPCPVGAIWAQQRRGAGDPTHRQDGAGRWRGVSTPEGPATLLLGELRGGRVEARAWGPGASWALDSVPGLLGGLDDPTGFEPRHPVLADVVRRRPHWRLGRTGRVLEALVPAIIEQKVTGKEAFAGFRGLVRRFGTRAPGPGADHGLWIQPTAETLRHIPSWEWLAMGIDPARSRAVVTVARVASSLERIPVAEADRRLRSLPGVGIWTSAEVRQRAFGDADAVSFGDYHLATQVGRVLAGEPFDDARLAEFLEPWRPHRGRAAAYATMVALTLPRRGPRMAPRTHLPT